MYLSNPRDDLLFGSMFHYYISLSHLISRGLSYFLQVLRYTSENVFVPLTVGGGIRDFTDANGR